MCLDDRPADRQPQPHAVRLGRVKGLEQPIEIRRMNAAFNAGDYDAMTTFYAADAEFGDHMGLADVAQAAQLIGVPRGI